MNALAILLWNLAVFGVTAYYVFERGYSGWWFLFAVILFVSFDR